MNELRLILLVAGVLFIAGIAGFEWWRARRDRGPAAASASGSRRQGECRPIRQDVAAGDQRGARYARRGRRQPAGHRAQQRFRIGHAPRARHRHIRRSGRGCRGGRSGSRVGQPHASSRTSARTTKSRRCACSRNSRCTVRSWCSPGRRNPSAASSPCAWCRTASRGSRAARCARHSANAGFWHGPLDIYHLPDAEGRVIVSAAALAQPGTFDPSIMDSQRFSGLNLFSVLPGVAARARSLR